MKNIAIFSILIFCVIGCCKDEPICIYPEIYGLWNYNTQWIHLNKENTSDTIHVSTARIGEIELNKSGLSYIREMYQDEINVELLIDSTILQFTYVSTGTEVEYEIDSISQGYLEFYCDRTGKYGDIPTDVFFTYKLTK